MKLLDKCAYALGFSHYAKREYDALQKSRYFDPVFYREEYQGCLAADDDPLENFITEGWKAGRDPSINFSTNGYLRQYLDVAEKNANPLYHFIKYGQYEGRLALDCHRPVTINNIPSPAVNTWLPTWTRFMRHLIPQILIYREHFMRTFYAPYLGMTNLPNVSSEYVNTDRYGFRYSVYNGKHLSFDNLTDYESINIIMGGSSAFSWGVSNDNMTLASCMSELTGKPWLNMGVCSATIRDATTYLAMLGNILPKVENIIFLGSYNEIGTFFTGDYFAQTFGGAYSNTDFNAKINDALLHRYLPDQLWGKEWILLNSNRKDKIPLLHEALSNGIFSLMHQTKALGTKLIYINQPYSDWTFFKLSAIEKNVCDAVIKIQASELYPDYHKNMAVANEWLPDFLRTKCEECGALFFDSNPVFKTGSENKPLFVDPVHLSDTGINILTKLIIEHIGASSQQ